MATQFYGYLNIVSLYSFIQEVIKEVHLNTEYELIRGRYPKIEDEIAKNSLQNLFQYAILSLLGGSKTNFYFHISRIQNLAAILVQGGWGNFPIFPSLNAKKNRKNRDAQTYAAAQINPEISKCTTACGSLFRV